MVYNVYIDRKEENEIMTKTISSDRYFSNPEAAVEELMNMGFIMGQKENEALGDDTSWYGECGDYGHGSRLYMHRPEGGYNQFGVGIEHATVSYLPRGWLVSIFGGPYGNINV